jgi:sec-independent protein translocase protein TatB
LRTVGKYLGIVRRHAAEFRAQFDEALREAELQDLKKEIEGVGHEVRSTIEQGGTAIDKHVMTARTELDGVIGGRPRPVEPAPSKSEAP